MLDSDRWGNGRLEWWVGGMVAREWWVGSMLAWEGSVGAC